MTEIFQSFLAKFSGNAEAYLLLVGILIVLLLLFLIWNTLLQQKFARHNGLQLDLKFEEQESRLAASTSLLQRQNQEAMQHGLQGLQAVVSDRLAGLERQLLQDSNAMKLSLIERFEQQQKRTTESLSDARVAGQRESAELKQFSEASLNRHREGFEVLQREAIKSQQEMLATTLEAMGRQINESFTMSATQLGKQVEGLTKTTDERLKEISGQVEKRLTEGFEKTTETFSQVLQHLTRIDEAQKKITELSTSVVSLQEVLTDKRSRGAFGEVQLEDLVRNVMPQASFEMQASIGNDGKRVDCLLRLPEPSGNIPIDAKFPLESYQRMVDVDLVDSDRKAAATQFKKDIKKHIQDIASKYIIAGETADGAVMFLPAEAVFAEIHAHFPDLVEFSHQSKVWMVSPTTLMAVLTTARAVLKDDATRKQVHVIQDHLRRLSEDFGRFQKRMDSLAKHINQANNDVEQVAKSATKLTRRFVDIDAVQLPEITSDD